MFLTPKQHETRVYVAMYVCIPLRPPRRDLGQVLFSQLPWCFGVKLRQSIRPMSGAPLSNSGLEEALWK